MTGAQSARTSQRQRAWTEEERTHLRELKEEHPDATWKSITDLGGLSEGASRAVLQMRSGSREENEEDYHVGDGGDNWNGHRRQWGQLRLPQSQNRQGRDLPLRDDPDALRQRVEQLERQLESETTARNNAEENVRSLAQIADSFRLELEWFVGLVGEPKPSAETAKKARSL
ncbi:uncharacterized protein DSM5745_00727 [Aspergillus mulundensis]|uniref:Myb-like domain-containing protein n=1 Tax=Aspergillus mulundensis TaxID=1810919 RepID=A0A3D8T4C7_9EURO|nr:hypothetical protein DSM5745_00727 [Aspergillus mulundensis]RDW93405.1 hypothetical protein DSM5745_00727 [Aspergillus mulundensis]